MHISASPRVRLQLAAVSRTSFLPRAGQACEVCDLLCSLAVTMLFGYHLLSQHVCLCVESMLIFINICRAVCSPAGAAANAPGLPLLSHGSSRCAPNQPSLSLSLWGATVAAAVPSAALERRVSASLCLPDAQTRMQVSHEKAHSDPLV